ncbi:DNRLRE domain-containing protein, partial [Actinocrinis puniceicyclus]
MRVPVRARSLRCITPATLALSLAAAALLAAHPPQHPATRLPATAPAASSTRLSAAMASARARATGQAVVADALTTATDQTTANPDGSFTLTTSPAPVRVQRHGAWVPLDATLVKNPDGTYSPAATPAGLVLSGGGADPLAILSNHGRQLAVTLPVSLPAPAVTGATAIYPGLLPDVDLVVTATPEGGYSDVFVVKTANAAANPSLRTLMRATLTGTGVSLTTDAAGNLTAATSTGTPIFTAPAPAIWDSATAPATGTLSAGTASPNPSPTGTAAGTDPVTGAPLASSVTGPGEGAHQASLDAALSGSTLTLSPPASVLTGSATSYPVYIDPSVGPSVASWTMVNSYYATTSYFNSGTNGRMQVGYDGWDAPYFTARSFTTLNLSGVPAGAQVSSAQVNFFEDVAPSCSAREVDLWTTGGISSGTTWNSQPAWNSKIGSESVAKGYSGCSAGGVGFDITSQVASTRGAGGTSLTLGLRAANESDAYAWKQFNGNLSTETKTTASVTYDQAPDQPTGLYTSPSTDCSSTTLGDTAVTLYAPVSDPDGGSLTTTFNFYYASDGAKTNLLTSAHGIPSDTYTGNSGVTAALPLPESFFKTLAGSTPTTFTWKAVTSDGTLTSPWSTECSFTW